MSWTLTLSKMLSQTSSTVLYRNTGNVKNTVGNAHVMCRTIDSVDKRISVLEGWCWEHEVDVVDASGVWGRHLPSTLPTHRRGQSTSSQRLCGDNTHYISSSHLLLHSWLYSQLMLHMLLLELISFMKCTLLWHYHWIMKTYILYKTGYIMKKSIFVPQKEANITVLIN